MSRLLHSPTGFIRSLQISSIPLFGFVEGRDIDSFFYGAICQKVCTPHNLKYQIKRAMEIPQQAEGKSALLSFYRYLKGRKKLLSIFHGKKTLILFFFDKDVDDIIKKKCRSTHVIYTIFYDVHNHIFIHGNLSKAIAAAASLDEQEVRLLFLAQGDWCKNAAYRWRMWVVYCLFCQLHGVGNANYRVASKINLPLNGPVDNHRYNTVIEEARQALGWSAHRMHKEIARIEQLVEKYFKSGTQDIIFKGKWYKTILERDLRDTFQGRETALNGVANRITSALAITLDLSQAWAKHFTTALENIVCKEIL